MSSVTPHHLGPDTEPPPATTTDDAAATATTATDDAAATATTAVATDETGTGLVVRVYRSGVDLDTTSGTVRASWGGPLLASIAADPEQVPCTGDLVGWRAWPDGRTTVEQLLPRRTLLARGEASGGSRRQLLAANVDVVAVVEGLVPDPEPRRVERLLALAWASGAEPVLVLTKADLVADLAGAVEQLAASAVGCRVLPVSSVSGQGLDDVRAMLSAGSTVVMLGASGVGKSSLLNALTGAGTMRVHGLRADGKGRHTTVTRELHRVGGGALIDNPGLRAVALDDDSGLEQAFADVLQWAPDCRFSDCSHLHEPGCAVLAAIDRGDLEPDRLDGWHRLLAEGRRQAARRDARLQAEQRRAVRVQARQLRRTLRSRP